MKHLLCSIALLLAFMGSAQDVPKAAPAGKNPDLVVKAPVAAGYLCVLHSRILGEERTISVALPEGYLKTTKTYPVLYMVDGQSNFLHTMSSLGAASGSGQIPEMILVAVHTQTFRERDLLPTMDKKSATGGGADSFHRFFKEELIPAIEKQFRTAPYRLLTGTSFGGVFVMHAMLKDPTLFNAYLALSPSMWWDGEVMLQRTQEFLEKTPGLGGTLFLSLANEGPGMGVDALARLLKSKAPSGLIWKFEKYPNEMHGTIAFRSTYDGLRFVFADWKKDPVLVEMRGDLVSSGDVVQVELKGKGKSIRYTLDGTEPGLGSAVYEKPLFITQPAVLKAVPIYGNNLIGNTSTAVIDDLKPLPAETELSALKSGLNYSYVEGDWDQLPDFAKLIPVKTGVAANLSMGERKRDNLFAFKFTGFLDIPEDNVYLFHLTSDDGSRLLLGDQVIVDNDGLHGDEERSGKVLLKKGKHRISILYFQKTGGITLKLTYTSNKMSRREVPLSAFYCPEK